MLTSTSKGNTWIGKQFKWEGKEQYASQINIDCPNLEFREVSQKTIKQIEDQGYDFDKIKTMVDCFWEND